MRILFAGSPEIAVPSLARIAFEHQVAGVLTNPDSPSGRGLVLASTPVATAAASLFQGAVPILPFARLDAEARATVAALEPEILVSFAYGRIFGPRFLALFPRGGLNVHPSLLPRYRGPTPIPAAILHRDAETGVTVQRLAAGIDEGAILGVERIPLAGFETTEELSETASLIGADLLSAVLADLEAGRAVDRPQEGEPSRCGLLGKDDGHLDWILPVLDLDARVRAFSPWPVAFTALRGQRLAILESHPYPGVTYAPPGSGLDYEFDPPLPGTILGLDKSRGLMVQGRDGLIALRRLQLQHKKALPYREFANGMRDLAGVVLGS